jgi:hypothetical protein
VLRKHTQSDNEHLYSQLCDGVLKITVVSVISSKVVDDYEFLKDDSLEARVAGDRQSV